MQHETREESELRLRKNLDDHSSDDDNMEEEDLKTDLVKRIIESTKELTDCMPTDLPSAKRMVISNLNELSNHS